VAASRSGSAENRNTIVLRSGEASELTRLADGLSKTRTPGAIADDISTAINTDGLKALAEFQVVRERLAEKGTPDQVKALDEAVLGGVPEEQRDQLKTLLLPKSEKVAPQSAVLKGQDYRDAVEGKHNENLGPAYPGGDQEKIRLSAGRMMATEPGAAKRVQA